ncbi:C2H2 type master regulator of conidiophore development brlA [Fusarium oxysporum f. sp. albedinis]|nr:C2H2 type master regulator of conidiophore development brlA [Fusarium oxysporum f. sp. albedinis]
MLPRFTICDNFTESPTYLVCDKTSWNRKRPIRATKQAMELNITICEFGWLLDVFHNQTEDCTTGPKSHQILWPEQQSVQLVRRPNNELLAEMREFYRKMLNRKEARRPLLREAITHLNRLIKIYPYLPVEKDATTAVRTRDLDAFAVDNEERVFRHSITAQPSDLSTRSDSTDPLQWSPKRIKEKTRMAYLSTLGIPNIEILILRTIEQALGPVVLFH